MAAVAGGAHTHFTRSSSKREVGLGTSTNAKVASVRLSFACSWGGPWCVCVSSSSSEGESGPVDSVSLPDVKSRGSPKELISHAG